VDEANQQSLVSRGACAALAVSIVVPLIEYTAGEEPSRKTFVAIFLASMKRDHPPWLMAVWFVPPIVALARLAGASFKWHVAFAATSVFLGICEVFFSWLGQGGSTLLSKLQVYFGIEGIVPAAHFGLHGALIGGVSAVWFFDELWARRTFRALDHK